MRMKITQSPVASGLALGSLLLGLAACSDAGTGAGEMADATISLQQGVVEPLLDAALVLPAGYESTTDPAGNSGPPVHRGPIDPSLVDSLMVTVTRVEVLPDPQQFEFGEKFAWGGPNTGQGGHGQHRFGKGTYDGDWYSLDVVGNGRIDLMHLPAEADNGLIVAAGEIPPGVYSHVRLFVSDAMIWFNTIIERPNGVRFEPEVGYTVVIPSVEETGIKTHVDFEVPDGGSEIVLVFDTENMMARAVATGSGEIIVAPVLKSKPHWGYGPYGP
ncbi:MAG: DUF4382 domain-containing protein [Gemmatimonadota bacterium]|nr:MAG: DUF4382 domain-containing protein [Gemmatimonadota bacterium]